jgi:hypothetical protein
MTTQRVFLLVLLALVAAGFAAMAPEIQRYLKIRSM